MCSGCKPKNKKLNEYQIIRGSMIYVEAKVNELISQGWELNGTLQIVDIDNQPVAVQGMVQWIVNPNALVSR